jgi:hypothetical protein
MGRVYTEEQKAVKRARQQLPENVAKRKEYDKKRYHANKNKPEYIARVNSEEYKAYHKAYTSTPEYKEKERQRKATPEYKAKQRIRNASPRTRELQKKYWESPKGREAARRFRRKPEHIAFMKEYNSAPERRDARKAYSQTDKFKEMQKQYQSTEEYKERRRAKYRERMDNDMNFKLQTLIRTRVRRFIKGTALFGHSVELLGCSLDEARAHIESQFQEGMTWNNWSHKGWVLDHIRPVASFDLTKEEDLRACWNYKNLQPLWYSDNCKKSSIWEGKFYVKGVPL